jgi:SAM-dependent methyltransferase
MTCHDAVGTPADPGKNLPLDWVACSLCGNDRTVRIYQAQGFWLVRCSGCGLAYINPRLPVSVRDQVYDDDYIRGHTGGEALDGDAAWILEPTSWEAMRLRYSTQGITSGRLLEVGCATGRFLWSVKLKGWEVWGVEFNRQAARSARKRLAATVLDGDFLDAHLPSGYFDVVCLFHVIEHMLDPYAAVRRIHGLLRLNGRLVLECPDFGSRGARSLGPNWIHVQPKEHLYYFDAASLRKLLERSGFRVEKVRRCGGLGVLKPVGASGAPNALRVSAFRLRHWLAPTPWLRNLARRFYWDLLRQSDNILVVASRRL